MNNQIYTTRKNYLDIIAEENYSTLQDDMNRYTPEYFYSIIKQHIIKNASILELGCADGAMTRLLVDDFCDITVIDGSSIAIKRLEANIKNWKGTSICSFFEDIQNLPHKYDAIIMGHVMEHVEHPVDILIKYKQFLTESGKIIIAVPNAKSFHRLAAVKMGLLESIYDLNNTDRKVGHLRVYDYNKLLGDVEKSGLKVVKRDGYWLKFLSNKQIEQCMDYNAISAYFALGREFVENAAEIIAVCENNV